MMDDLKTAVRVNLIFWIPILLCIVFMELL